MARPKRFEFLTSRFVFEGRYRREHFQWRRQEAVNPSATLVASRRLIGSVRFARYSAQELATASPSLSVGTLGGLDGRTEGNGPHRRWRQNGIRRNAASFGGDITLWTSVRRHGAAVWQCQFARRASIRLWRRSSKHLHEPSSEMKIVVPACLSGTRTNRPGPCGSAPPFTPGFRPTDRGIARSTIRSRCAKRLQIGILGP